MCACVLQGVLLFQSPSKWPKSSPFIVEGRARTVHVLTIRHRANRGGVSEPCGLFLWRRGRQSGPSLEYWAAWSSHQILCVVGAPGMPRSGRGGDHKPLWTDYARGRNLVGAEAGTAVGGSRQA